MNRIIGALWKKEKDGKEYFSGVLQDLHGEIKIAIFPNNYKEAANQPDFNIIISIGDRQTKTNGEAKEAKPTKNDKKKGGYVIRRSPLLALSPIYRAFLYSSKISNTAFRKL